MQRGPGGSDLLIVGAPVWRFTLPKRWWRAYGGPMALINRDATPQDNRADLVVHATWASR